MSERIVEHNDTRADYNISMGGSSMEEEVLTQNETNKYGEINNRGGDWILSGGEKRRKSEKIEICVTITEKLPQQFTFAKLFQKENIEGIQSINCRLNEVHQCV